MFSILIDSGTTNSRIRLVQGNGSNIIDMENIKVGVRNTAIEGTNVRLKEEITIAIDKIIERNQLTTADIKYIVASGMITSNLGLYEVPHVIAPAKVTDFSTQSKLLEEQEVFHQIPCLFVPGMKNNPVNFSKERLMMIDELDMMRGEEVEATGLIRQMHPSGKGVIVLPGSHTKFLLIDEKENFLSSVSTLGGEVIYAIQSTTILSSSLEDTLLAEVKPELILKGYYAAEKVGLTRSFYHIRLLDLFSDMDANERANYFVGIVLNSDMKSLQAYIKGKSLKWVIIGGSNPLRSCFVCLIQHIFPDLKIIEADDRQVEKSMIIGAQEIAGHVL